MSVIENQANIAYRTVLAYSTYSGRDEDVGAGISHLIADLLHLADQYGGSEDHLRLAVESYEATKGEGESHAGH